MSPEQYLLAGISGVTAGLCFLFNILRVKSDACEKWRSEKEPIINLMAQKLGIAEGALNMIDHCPQPGCPYAGKVESQTFSLDKADKETKKKP